ncbi:hypothetical protein UCRNP2_7558 [Neofusicoccum parvum UCRNP2]|uniref:Integral membrane protein n=1 Tax=Botryosphaeria parva (strain UCR-NP2) TaxID=1287680 RepID=R1G2S7_BOTPV|nr:hypothetical protein UCRNP2_7558 [Neofusicoccum parvum UCRNP2]
MTGTLVPPGWKFYEVTPSELAIVSIVWGFTLGWSVFAAGTAIRQTLQTRQRKKRITTYIAMVWAELIVSFVIGFFGWFFMMGMIPPSFEFFFFVLVFWVVQVQVILQIIVNRVGLLLPDKRFVRNMKWTVVVYVGIINVSVFCIWLPAQLQRSETYVRVNHVWDRVTKALFLLVDAALNWYFLYMVHRDLIANGLHKYTKLFWTNATMAIISVFMDVAIILSMFFKNPFVYVQFHPLAYQIKLSIEMSLADLIAKVVRASHEITETHDFGSSAVSGPTDDWRNARLTVDGPGPSGLPGGWEFNEVVTH